MLPMILAWFSRPFAVLSTALSPQLWAAARGGAEEEPLLVELWNYFVDKYFTLHFENYRYEHIDVTQTGIVSLRAVIVASFVGIIIAAACTLFQKRTLGDLIRAIDREDANTPARAMTLEQLGLLRNSAIKQNLRRGTALRRVVRCVEEEAYRVAQAEKQAAFEADEANHGRRWRDIPYRPDFFHDHFYIPEDKIGGALSQFNQKGTNPLVLAFALIFCVVAAAICCRWLPELIQILDNFVGMFDGAK